MLKRKLANSEEFKELEKRDKLRHILEERKKSANERELERFNQEDREKLVKMALDKRRKQQRNEFFRTNIFPKENIFKGKQVIMDNDTSVLKNNNKLLHGSNMFLHGLKKTKRKGGLFFN